MATMRAADSWQQARAGYERPPIPGRGARREADPPGRGGDYRRGAAGSAGRPARPPVPPADRRRRARDDQDRFEEREMQRGAAEYRRSPARTPSRPARGEQWERSVRMPQEGARGSRRPAPVADTSGRRLRGVVAIIGMFLVTLAGAAADSFLGMGLGRITLGALVVAAVLATWLVRRRDLLSLVVAPPLVFVAVALVNVGLAPSATLSLPTLATLLIRGFPTMALATGAAIVIALIRAASRR